MAGVDVSEGVVFGEGGGRALRCDIYVPERRGGVAPALLLFHGGGWRAGDRGMMRDFGRQIGADGFVCVAAEYRLTGESPWPAQIEDVKAAIRWTRAKSAELGVDEARIAAMGFSAGAHLALLAAGTPGLSTFAGSGGSAEAGEALAAVIAVYPPVVFYLGEERPTGASPANALLGDAATAGLAHAASPLTYVKPGFPPVFLIHGTADKVVPPSASRVIYDALVKAGAPVEMHLYAGQPHGFARQPEFVDIISAESVHFLRRALAIGEVGQRAQAAALA